MKRGLTLGKYAPLHKGHQFVIETALAEMDEVVVIWQVPPIIPYDGIFLSSTLSADTRIRLKNALDLIYATDEGKVLFDALFDIKGILQVEDIFYVEFNRYIQSSGIDLNNLVH